MPRALSGPCWVCRLQAMYFLLYIAQLSVLINLNSIKLFIQGFKSLTSAIIQSSDLRRNLLQEVVQDHGRGLTGEVSHGYWRQGETKSTHDPNSRGTSQA